ncbi:MAG: alpha/beta fold hydrolase [Streptomyces sp.]|uniref:alpha/beta hydrolase n=1 Tax=Streptomyces sp. TaxID=1931 RepID=UPI0025D073CB|nr:alpha/beta hydrolase [Streptomyces sp.]MBW8796718.1 alpha/beta fold hydrolase [Streptomyces sp.]
MHIRRITRRTPIRPRARTRTMAAALLSAATLLASACSSAGNASTATSAATSAGTAQLAALPRSTPSALVPYYDQKLTWRECGVPGFQCATMKAPLDYAEPGAGDVRLAVARKKATGKAKPLGSLLVNPGGPGGSAVDYLQQYAGIGYPAEVRARYDMVAVDPRGVARSEPVECLDGPQMDTFTETDMTPDDQRETDRLVEEFKTFAEACGKHSAQLLRHVSTVDSARDMDILRAVLGDPKLNYVGASYGTFLGATYAGLFPSRVGRMVLDGAMNPSLSARELNLQQTAGFETAFQSFARDCAKRTDCPLGAKGSTPTQIADDLRTFFQKLDAHPVPTGDPDGRKLTESLATTGVIAAMYDQAEWEQLRDALRTAMKDNDGAGLLALSDSYYERDSDGRYSNLMFANAAVNCLDLPPAFTSPEGVDKALPEFEKASPVFGPNLAWASLNCAYWPVRATGEPHRIAAKGAAPIVVVGTTRDPATPYPWARSLAAQLSSGRLLTYVGDGHTAYGRGSACIDTAIDTYLLDGTPPAKGKRCS